MAKGRQPHQRWYQQWRSDDERIIKECLELTNTLELSDTPLEELSGGQRQRAWIAMALAQETPVLMLDEPTTYLDLSHALDVLVLVRSLARDLDRGILMVLHDLGLAARFSDRIIVMHKGRTIVEGTPPEVVTPSTLNLSFGLDCTVYPDPYDGTPTVTPLIPRASPLPGGLELQKSHKNALH